MPAEHLSPLLSSDLCNLGMFKTAITVKSWRCLLNFGLSFRQADVVLQLLHFLFSITDHNGLHLKYQ